MKANQTQTYASNIWSGKDGSGSADVVPVMSLRKSDIDCAPFLPLDPPSSLLLFTVSQCFLLFSRDSSDVPDIRSSCAPLGSISHSNRPLRSRSDPATPAKPDLCSQLPLLAAMGLFLRLSLPPLSKYWFLSSWCSLFVLCRSWNMNGHEIIGFYLDGTSSFDIEIQIRQRRNAITGMKKITESHHKFPEAQSPS